MCDLHGAALSTVEREVLQHPLIGGVILFERNYESPAQLYQLTEQLHALRTPPLLIGVDQEGGRIQRFHNGFSRLPSSHSLGKLYANNPRQASAVASSAGWLMATELLATGVDFSFAPVLDLDRGNSMVLSERTFSRNPDVVTTLARYYIRGMHRAGMAAVGKHFPGHGGVKEDSHTETPVDQREYRDLYMADMRPFIRLATDALAAIMPAHIRFPHVDEPPAGFSRVWLQQVLRKELRFGGAIFSDDLNMQGAATAGDLPQRARAALDAGCDMVLLCNSQQKLAQVIDALSTELNPVSQPRLLRMHGKPATFRKLPELSALPEWKKAVDQIAPCLMSALDKPE